MTTVQEQASDITRSRTNRQTRTSEMPPRSGRLAPFAVPAVKVSVADLRKQQCIWSERALTQRSDETTTNLARLHNEIEGQLYLRAAHVIERLPDLESVYSERLGKAPGDCTSRELRTWVLAVGEAEVLRESSKMPASEFAEVLTTPRPVLHFSYLRLVSDVELALRDPASSLASDALATSRTPLMSLA